MCGATPPVRTSSALSRCIFLTAILLKIPFSLATSTDARQREVLMMAAPHGSTSTQTDPLRRHFLRNVVLPRVVTTTNDIRHMKSIEENDIETSKPVEGFITKAEVAHRLRRTTRTVDAWMKCGVIPFYKPRRSVLFRWQEVEQHIVTNYRIETKNVAMSKSSKRREVRA